MQIKFVSLQVLILQCISSIDVIDSAILWDLQPFQNVIQLDALTSEDVRYASQICQQQSATKNQTLRMLWSQWSYPSNVETHCYVHCLLHKLGLIDLHTRGLNLRRLFITWQAADVKLNDSCMDAINLNIEANGNCLSTYNNWMEFQNKCPDLLKSTFGQNKLNLSMAPIQNFAGKPLGTAATRYCAHLLALQNNAVEVRRKAAHNELNLVQQHKPHLDCIFRHLRYFDAYGRLDINEILQSFSEAHIKLSVKDNQTVAHCLHLGNSKYEQHRRSQNEMAAATYSCLVKANLRFQNAFHVRDLHSQQY